jgi:cytochrome c-type biogenesis protein CcmF
MLAGAAPLLAWRKTTRERLYGQLAMPGVLTAGAVIALVIAAPQTMHRSAIFSDTLQLPVSLINFGLCAFVVGSIAQEYWRGVKVRKAQTGSDAISSLFGLILSKRRKYGGYIIHLGVAVLFIGFAGKAYERMVDRTLEKPAAMSDHNKATFAFGDYEFTYERLIQTSDDHKNAVTAEITIWQHGQKINTVYPAKWDYHRGEGQATTEVAITVGPSEDVYVVLTGYDTDSGLANLRVYINPLILWVWIGFLILAVGTLICLIPQGIVDLVAGQPRQTRLGRAAELGAMLLLIGGVVGGIASQAHAAAQPAEHAEHSASGGDGTEHVQAGMGMGADGIGFTAMNRPTNDTEERAMKELLCVCGCARESIFSCKCGTAAQLRKLVQDFLGQTDTAGNPTFDLKTPAGRDKAYEAVLAYFIKQYGGEQVLATPRSQLSWLFPSLAVVGGLALVVAVGRRWVHRGPTTVSPAAMAAAARPDNDAYADKLDDELADTD